MRVLVVSQYFWPENFRINDLCSEMVKQGYSVTVLTGEPNYPSGKKDNNYLKNKEIYSFYNGCDIVRVPLVARGGGKLKLILNYMSYFILASSIGIWKLRDKQFDVVFVCQLSPVTIAVPAIIYRKIYKVPIIMWVLDLWPDTLKAVGMIKSERGLNIINKLVQFIYNRCDLILGQSNRFVGAIRKNCNSTINVDYFPSWAEGVFENKFTGDIKNKFDIGFFNLLFAGNVGEAQDIPTVLKALEILKLKGVKVKLHIVGDGRNYQNIKAAIANRDLKEYVRLWGRYPLDAMPEFYTAANVLFVSLKKNPVFSMTIPGKVQSYMMAAKPILASLDGEGAEVILQANCGLVSKPNDYHKLAVNIEAMIELEDEELVCMGMNGKLYAEKNFNRSALMSKLFFSLESVVKKNRAARL